MGSDASKYSPGFIFYSALGPTPSACHASPSARRGFSKRLSAQSPFFTSGGAPPPPRTYADTSPRIHSPRRGVAAGAAVHSSKRGGEVFFAKCVCLCVLRVLRGGFGSSSNRMVNRHQLCSIREGPFDLNLGNHLGDAVHHRVRCENRRTEAHDL